MSTKQKWFDALSLALIVFGAYFLALGILSYVQGESFDHVPNWTWILTWCGIGAPMFVVGILLHVRVLRSRRNADGPNHRLQLTGNARE